MVNRFQADNIQTLDPTRDFATVSQCSTGNGSNPHDIAVLSPTKAYVTRYELTTLLVVTPSVGPTCDGFVLDTVDLAQFADADGIPEMDQMAIVDGVLYVSLQQVNRNNSFNPAGNGIIAVVDTASDTVVGQIVLTGENPFGNGKGLTVRDGMLVIAEAGRLASTMAASNGSISPPAVRKDSSSRKPSWAATSMTSSWSRIRWGTRSSPRPTSPTRWCPSTRARTA